MDTSIHVGFEVGTMEVGRFAYSNRPTDATSHFTDLSIFLYHLGLVQVTSFARGCSWTRLYSVRPNTQGNEINITSLVFRNLGVRGGWW
jgi:hypothetical protein